MTFVKGQSGNPTGKKPGTKHHATRLIEELMENHVEAVANTVIDAAKGGDMVAARMVLDRLVPPRRSRPVEFAIPEGDAATSLNGVLTAVANGELSPDEGQAVAAIIENKRKAVEMEQLEERLAAVEKMLAERNHR